MEAEQQVVEAVPTPIDRKALRQEALEKAQAVTAGDGAIPPSEVRAALELMVSAFTPATKAPGGPRVLLDKAEPLEVAAFFESTGLTRKELAAAAEVSTSVIATVQNPKGDRWSLKTFEAKKVLIAAWTKAHAKEIKTRIDAEAAEAAAKVAATAAKAQARADREAAAAAKAAQPKAAAKTTKAPVSLAATKAAASKPGRPSKAARQANRKTAAK